MNDESLRYPVGKFKPQDTYTKEELNQCIERIESVPSRIDTLIKHFTSKQFATRYREAGWTARQVVHHISDSHMNAYIRFKWALTEETPMIKAYDEKLWAETPEVAIDPFISVNLLKALHVKWVALMRSLAPADLQREYVHPETQKKIRLDRLIALYAWHGDHHLGHLKIVAEKRIE
jgi:hypothetical protein